MRADFKNMNPTIEQARQKVILMLKLEDYAKKNIPEGKVYKGLRGKSGADGITFEPVYEELNLSPPPRNKLKGDVG